MDYMDEKEIKFYQSSKDFFESKKKSKNYIDDNKSINILYKI